jgi:hypothetical protein
MKAVINPPIASKLPAIRKTGVFLVWGGAVFFT